MRYILLALLLISTPTYAKKPGGILIPLTLERVVDGDTFVASGRKIRLWGMDAPERNEDLFNISTIYLKTILQDPALSCKFVEKDRYKRDVMQCFVGGADIASMMVQMGMARDYKKYSSNYYEIEEGDARENQRGIWRK